MKNKGADRLNEVWGNLTEQIIETMSTKGLDWVKDWAVPAPVNAVTGKRYRGRNALLLMFAEQVFRYEDPRFCTFKTAKDQGWRIKKGAKAWPVAKYKPFYIDKSDPTHRLAQPKTAEDIAAYRSDPNIRVVLACVGYFNLFNASQIEGIEPYDRSAGTVVSPTIDTLKNLSVCYVNESLSDRAYYSPSRDEICIPSRKQFSSTDAMARVLLHEQAHATGAETRLNRSLCTSFGSEAYAREELVAELAALFCANELGISLAGVECSGPDASYWNTHAAYLKIWSSSLENPAEELRHAASLAADAADMILRPYRDQAAPDAEEMAA